MSAVKPLYRALALLTAMEAALYAQSTFANTTVDVFPTPTTQSPLPTQAPFYIAPDAATLQSTAPGALLRYRQISPKASKRKAMKAQAWQLMFRTTDHKGNAVAGITTTFLPANAPADARKIVVFNPEYNSLTLDCSASDAYVKGKENVGQQSLINPYLKKGYVVVVPDHEGLQSLWAVGKNAGHHALDAIRAAESFEPLGLDGASTPVAITGYSGGSVPSMWANELYPTYAPELNILGVVAGGIPVNIAETARKVNGKFFSALYFGVITSYARGYPEIGFADLANAKGKAMLDDVANRCTSEGIFLLKYAGKKVNSYTAVPELLDDPKAREALADNHLGQFKPGAPMHLYNGRLDQVMSHRDVSALKDHYCAQGATVKMTTMVGEHVVGKFIGPTLAVPYIDSVLNGDPAPNDCQ